MNKGIPSVKVSVQSKKKAEQLRKFMKLSKAKRFWGKDQKLLGANLLLVPSSIHYKVLLALGRSKKKMASVKKAVR